MTGRPAACRALALASTLRVADSAIAESLRESGARSFTATSVVARVGRRRGVRAGSDHYRGPMSEWMWSAVIMSVAVIVAGGIAWWLARGCVVTIIGAVGAILGGLASLGCLVVLLDPDVALRAAPLLTAASGIWLLVWAFSGAQRNKRLA